MKAGTSTDCCRTTADYRLFQFGGWSTSSWHITYAAAIHMSRLVSPRPMGLISISMQIGKSTLKIIMKPQSNYHSIPANWIKQKKTEKLNEKRPKFHSIIIIIMNMKKICMENSNAFHLVRAKWMQKSN